MTRNPAIGLRAHHAEADNSAVLEPAITALEAKTTNEAVQFSDCATPPRPSTRSMAPRALEHRLETPGSRLDSDDTPPAAPSDVLALAPQGTGPEDLRHDAPGQTTEGPPGLARNLGALAGAQLVTWTMTFAWILVVPRFLGPAEFGTLVSAQSVAALLCIVLSLALSKAFLVRKIVLHHKDGPELVGTALLVRILLVPLVIGGAVLWSLASHYDHQAQIVLYLISGMTVAMMLAEPMQAAFQALERMRYLARGDIINKSGQSIIGIALVVLGFKVTAIAASMAVMTGSVVLLDVLWLRRYLRIDMHARLSTMVSMLKQSMSFWAIGLFGMIYLWIDTVMLSRMAPPRVVGWYGASTQLFQTLLFVAVITSTAWLPRLVAAFTSGHRHLIETARTPLELMLLMGVVIAAATATGAPLLVRVAYGPAFAQAVPVLVILAFCLPPMYVNIMLGQVVIAAGRQVMWTYAMIGAAVFNPLLNLVLIPATQSRYHNGAIGAGVSLVLTELVMNVYGFIIVGRHLLNRSVLTRLSLVIMASAGMWGVAFAARPLGMLPSLLAGAAALVVLIVALRIPTDSEIALLRGCLVRLKGRG